MIALGSEAMVASGKNRAHVVHGGVKVDALPEGSVSTGDIWTPPILKCIATKNEGITELVAALERHHTWIATTELGKARRRQRLREEIRESLRESLIDAAARALKTELDDAADKVAAREIDPYTATEALLTRFKTS